MENRIIWLSYDLGIQGDYPSLYEWLDKHQAKECGDNIAFLHYQSDDNFIETLKQDLSNHIQFNPRDRMYLIWQEKDKMKGEFLFGRRKASPWEGFAFIETAPDEI